MELKQQQHVVCIPFPAQGHLRPIIRFAEKLAEAGLKVTVINNHNIHDLISPAWKNGAVKLESVRMQYEAPIGFDSSCAGDVSSFVDALLAMEAPLQEHLVKMQPPVSCVISDFYHLGAGRAALRAGIQSVAWWPGCAAWASIELQIPKLLADGVIPIPDAPAKGEHISYLPGLGDAFPVEQLPLDLRKGWYDAAGRRMYEERASRAELREEKYFLMNTLQELEPEIFAALSEAIPGKTFVPVGPLFDLNAQAQQGEEVHLRQEDDRCVAWLDEQAPGSVLYVSFGSAAQLSGEEFQQLAHGLKASKQPFLWVARDDLAADGLLPDGFMAEFQSETRGTGLVVTWAPQLKVLQHASVGGFLTHCGWNSVFEGICAGVPLLGLPLMFEQNTNCSVILEKKGYGAHIGSPVRASSVTDAIRRLFHSKDGSKLRCKAREAAAAAWKAVKDGGSSQKNLKRFFTEVLSGH